MSSSSVSFSRAHEAYLTPPDFPESRLQFEGFFIFKNMNELAHLNLGELEDISWSEAEVSEEDDCLRIWCTAWLNTESNGDHIDRDLGDMQSSEIVDSENVIFERDPDEEYDRRGEWD